ncbi:type VII secretion protein EccC, partial [Streptomyces sp. me109]|uniref:FtsK/SpoIIIE domain-containing protein n=1 Tax=Streptomyces sp. me109 TaxID=1827853 RepID=UPI001360354F
THTPHEVQFYGLDFGGGGLAAVAGLPHVGGVASRLDPEKVRRTVAEVYGVMTRREEYFRSSVMTRREEYFRSSGISSIAEFRTKRARGDVQDDALRRLVVATEVPPAVDDQEDVPPRLVGHGDPAARGLGYGIHLVLTASRSMEVRANLKDHLMNRLELRLGDTMDSELDRKVAANVPTGVPGRGQSPQKLHFMGAVPRIDGLTSDTDLADATAALATEVSRH